MPYPIADEDADDIDDNYYDPNDAADVEDPQMDESVVAARKRLGDGFSDQEIRDSLWHYYYDVDKTVSWLQSNEHWQAV